MVNWMEYMNYDTLRQLAEKYEMTNRKNSLILIPFSAFPKVEKGNRVREYEWWAYAVESALSIESPAFAIANYIIDHNATVRQTAKKFGISKSTVHKDVAERLLYINPGLAKQARKVLDINKSERHIRGGLATKEKYLHQHELQL